MKYVVKHQKVNYFFHVFFKTNAGCSPMKDVDRYTTPWHFIGLSGSSFSSDFMDKLKAQKAHEQQF